MTVFKIFSLQLLNKQELTVLFIKVSLHKILFFELKNNNLITKRHSSCAEPECLKTVYKNLILI